MILNITDALRFMKGCYSPMKNFLKKLLIIFFIFSWITISLPNPSSPTPPFTTTSLPTNPDGGQS